MAPRYGAEPDEPGVITGALAGWCRATGRTRLVGWRAMHQAVLAAAEGCDLVHIQTPFVAHYAGLAAARRLGLPVIATYHTCSRNTCSTTRRCSLPAGWKAPGAGPVAAWCNALDGVIVPSTAMRERLLGYGVDAPLYVLPTGIPIERFRACDGRPFRRPARHRAGASGGLLVGRVAHEKHRLPARRAPACPWRGDPDVLLLIAGEGPARASWRPG